MMGALNEEMFVIVKTRRTAFVATAAIGEVWVSGDDTVDVNSRRFGGADCAPGAITERPAITNTLLVTAAAIREGVRPLPDFLIVSSGLNWEATGECALAPKIDGSMALDDGLVNRVEEFVIFRQISTQKSMVPGVPAR